MVSRLELREYASIPIISAIFFSISVGIFAFNDVYANSFESDPSAAEKFLLDRGLSPGLQEIDGKVVFVTVGVGDSLFSAFCSAMSDFSHYLGSEVEFDERVYSSKSELKVPPNIAIKTFIDSFVESSRVVTETEISSPEAEITCWSDSQASIVSKVAGEFSEDISAFIFEFKKYHKVRIFFESEETKESYVGRFSLVLAFSVDGKATKSYIW